MTSTIGVAIATYNGSKYIGEQLESILRQRVKPDLISISDDCSEDGTYEILKEFRSRSKTPVLLNSNPCRLGVIENFMIAFRQCQTDYIAYCDQDDVWDEDKIAVCREVLKRPGISLLFHRSSIVDQELKSLGSTAPHNLTPGLYPWPHFPDYLWGFGHQMVFSQEVLSAMTAIKESAEAPLAHIGTNFDRSLLIAAGMVGDIFFIDKELMKFRRHNGSVSQAGKAGSDRAGSSDDPRRSRIEESRLLMGSIMSGISTGTFRPILEGQRIETYVRHVRVMYERYTRRKVLYGCASRRTRVAALLQLLRSSAYGSMRKNRLPARQLGRDCWRSFR